MQHLKIVHFSNCYYYKCMHALKKGKVELFFVLKTHLI